MFLWFVIGLHWLFGRWMEVATCHFTLDGADSSILTLWVMLCFPMFFSPCRWLPETCLPAFLSYNPAKIIYHCCQGIYIGVTLVFLQQCHILNIQDISIDASTWILRHVGMFASSSLAWRAETIGSFPWLSEQCAATFPSPFNKSCTHEWSWVRLHSG